MIEYLEFIILIGLWCPITFVGIQSIFCISQVHGCENCLSLVHLFACEHDNDRSLVVGNL